jgi:hypothetical protein
MHWIIENCKTVRAADGITVIVDALKLLSVKHEKISCVFFFFFLFFDSSRKGDRGTQRGLPGRVQVDYRSGFAEAQCTPFIETAVDRRGAGGDFDVPWDAVPHRGSLSQ